MPDSEIDRLDPEPIAVPLSTGYKVGLQRMKTRQFFRLLKVLTRGVGPAVVQSLDFKDDPEAFGRNLLAMTLMAIPEAEQQFIEFLQSMCTPLGLHEAHGKNRLSKQQAEDNAAAVTELIEELNNPELDDLLTLAEEIVKQEAPEIQALGKRVASLIELAKKTGQLGDKSQETSSPEHSPEPSTSSATSTDGLILPSSSSPSAGSGSASRRRRPAASASS
jgi:hypothetical protein